MYQDSNEKTSAGRLLVPSLIIVYFSLFIVDRISGVFLVDVTMTFFGSADPAFVAITSQLTTVSMVTAAVFGVLLGVLSIRFNHKKLLLMGTICISVGALGCSLAPDFISLQIFFIIEGIGSTAVMAMAMTLVGELVALNKRPKTTGWILGGPSIGGVVGSLIINFFFGNPGSWRPFLMWWALPISLISVAAAYFVVPSPPQKQVDTVEKSAYFRSFKQVFMIKSAAVCLIANTVRGVSLMWGIYLIAFLMTKFGLSTGSGALVGIGFTVILGLGHFVGGYLVNRTGRKRLTVISLVIHGAALPLIAFMPDLLGALTILYAGTFIGAFAMPAGLNLILEQAPESRGTMMSVNNVLTTLGAGIGTAIGGVALTLFNYTGVFFTFGVLILISAAIFSMTKDPTTAMQPDSPKPELA